MKSKHCQHVPTEEDLEAQTYVEFCRQQVEMARQEEEGEEEWPDVDDELLYDCFVRKPL